MTVSTIDNIISMSQKTNPYSLRLQKTNQCFSSSWYSNYFYKEMTSNNLEMRSYIKGVFHQLGHSYEHFCLQNHYKRTVLFLFAVDVREIFHERQQALRFLQPLLCKQDNKSAKLTGKYGSEFDWKNSPQILPSLFAAKSSISKEWKQRSKPFVQCLSFKLCSLRGDDLLHRQVQSFGATLPESSFRNTVFSQARVFGEKTKAGYNYLYFHSNFRLSPLVSIFSVQALHDFSAVSFLIDEIIYLLYKNYNFRQITDYILQEAAKSDFIKGIRFSCSGRFGARSKKAQKSKTQSIQWGESSLHVFSSKLSFASKSALTPFGKIGVKLWLSYK